MKIKTFQVNMIGQNQFGKRVSFSTFATTHLIHSPRLVMSKIKLSYLPICYEISRNNEYIYGKKV